MKKFNLKGKLTATKKEARQMTLKYFKAYPRVKDWLERSSRQQNKEKQNV